MDHSISTLRSRLEAADMLGVQQELTISALMDAFNVDARWRYSDRGKSSNSELTNCELAFRPLRAAFGDKLAHMITPAHLSELQRHWCGCGLSCPTINSRISRVRRLFSWGVSRGMLDASVLLGLYSVAPVRPPQAPPGVAVQAVPIKTVEATYEHVVSPIVVIMLKLSLLTGLRPGECVSMRADEINNTRYTPTKHKNRWRSQPRVIQLGPASMELITPYLLKAKGGYLFRTRLGLPYTVNSYSGEVRKAVLRAIEAGDVQERWTIGQLRHTAITLCAERTGNRQTIQEYAGHLDGRISDNYLHTDKAARTYAQQHG